MERYQGVSISNNIVIDKCMFISQGIENIEPNIIDNVENEIEKFYVAQKKSIDQLEKLYNEARYMMLDKDAMILKSHQLIISDDNLVNKIKDYIKIFKYNASYSIVKAAQEYIDMFRKLSDDYLSQRADDIKDIMKRLINNLSGFDDRKKFDIKEKSILLLKDLMPSEILSIDRKKIAGIITQYGSKISHTAMLAQNMEIPMIVGVKAPLENGSGKKAILDGSTGVVIIDPDQETVNEYVSKKAILESNNEKLKFLIGMPSLTVDQREIKLMASIASSHDVKKAIDLGASGVGLYRSEFFYMNRNSEPSEKELFEEYKNTLIAAGGKKVIIRTLDLGSDKNVDFISLPEETNPALGVRGIRLCFDHLGLFKRQLRALFMASIYGELLIMIPMIVSVSEVIKVKEIINEIKESLRAEQIPFDDRVKLGVMIETPAAVMVSDLLAKHVDFFSIGTNDLIQYTLACDRYNSSLSEIYNVAHVSVLRMIEQIVDNAHRNNIWVEVCGEVAGNRNLTDKLIGLGVDGFSVDAANLLIVKNKIRNASFAKARENILKEIHL